MELKENEIENIAKLAETSKEEVYKYSELY